MKDQNVLRKIMGPIKDRHRYRIRYNKEFYQKPESSKTIMRRRKLIFFSYVVGMNNQKLTSRDFNTNSREKVIIVK